MTQPALHAADILDWDHLCRLAEYIEPARVRRWEQALKVFAYAFTSTPDLDKQDRLLSDLLRNATAHTSAESTEEVVTKLAQDTHSEAGLMREFARQRGVRLKRG